MNLIDVLSIIGLAIAVGVGVSMDVSGYNISMAGNREYSEAPIRRSLFHAFWHGLFLSLGIGLITAVGAIFEHLLIKYNLGWIFEWISNILAWLHPSQVVVWILAIVGIGLWTKLYYDKLRGEGGDEHVPGWLKWFLTLFKVPITQMMFVLVAVDMWFLTPLIKALIEMYTIAGKAMFVAFVFATVFTCSMISIKYGQRFLKSGNVKALFFWLVALVFIEPLITGYFGGRTAYWALTGTWDNNVSLILFSAVIVMILSIGKFAGIVEDKWDEANEAVHGKPQEPEAAA